MIQIGRCKRCRPTDLVELTEKCQKKGEMRQKHVMWLIPSQVAIEKVSKKRRKASKTCHHQIGRTLAKMQLLGHGHKLKRWCFNRSSLQAGISILSKITKNQPTLGLIHIARKNRNGIMRGDREILRTSIHGACRADTEQ